MSTSTLLKTFVRQASQLPKYESRIDTKPEGIAIAEQKQNHKTQYCGLPKEAISFSSEKMKQWLKKYVL